MAETNINAFKEELVVAEKELGRVKARVESLKAHIIAIEGEPIYEEPVEEEFIETTIKAEPIVKKRWPRKKGKK